MVASRNDGKIGSFGCEAIPHPVKKYLVTEAATRDHTQNWNSENVAAVL